MNKTINNFSPEEKIRYARQTILPMIGQAGQMRLKNARILLIGAATAAMVIVAVLGAQVGHAAITALTSSATLLLAGALTIVCAKYLRWEKSIIRLSTPASGR